MMNTVQDPEKSSSKSPKLVRALLSVFIVFHIFVIATLANGSSFLGRSFSPWINNYGNSLGLNVTWNFFAPDPAHTMYIHYFAHFEDGEPVEGYIPPEKEKIVIDTSKRRFLYAMRFLILDEKRMKVLLGPYLCRKHPGALSIHIENILEPIPNLDISHLTEDQQARGEAKVLDYNHSCRDAQDEVAL